MSTYIICEIGQNHNGSMELAKRLIDMATMPVMDPFSGIELRKANAVKLTKRDLNEELSESQMIRPYDSPHSFGKTYGEHRAALELSDEQHYELYQYAFEKGADLVETLCSKGCLTLLKHFTPARMKVASRDLTNLPLLEAMAETKIPMILSTGMSGVEELDRALETITKFHENITILHCLSQYPAQYHNINLLSIKYLKKRYPQFTIGYSDHSIGIMIPTAAVALGAEVIEKHVTLSRTMKGSDQAGSLEPNGVWRMVRDIRNLEDSLGEETFFKSSASEQSQVKLERSLATKYDLLPGHMIKEEDLMLLSPGDGFKWHEKASIIGKTVKSPIAKHEIIYKDLLQS